MNFPAVTPGAVVTEADAKVCVERGHAAHIVDGVESDLCPRCGETKTPATTVIEMAQAISRAIDEQGFTGDAAALFINPDEESGDDRRVTEVSAELKTTAMPSGDVSEFTVTTSDGRTFVVSVKEA